MTNDSRILDLLARFEELREAGAAPTPEELCREVPELLDQVRRGISDLAEMQPMLSESPRVLDGEASNGDVVLTSSFTDLRPHARGGLGEVLTADDTELGRRVALKRALPHAAARAEGFGRFLREARLTSGLEHPGVVPIHGLGRDATGRPCYAMRFVEGGTLRDALRDYHAEAPALSDSERRLRGRGLIQRFVAVCQTIAFAHSKGVIHRDLKPANVMLGAFGETIVIDWGLAKSAADSTSESRVIAHPAQTGETVDAMRMDTPGGEFTRHGQVVGTPAYMSPEQASGRLEQVGPASDQFSLGAMLFEIIAGEPIYSGERLDQVLERAARGEVRDARTVKRDVPAALAAICRKSMAEKPTDRYASVRELAADVERWLADEPISCFRETWSVRVARWSRKNRTVVSSTVAVLIVAAVSFAIIAAVMSANNEKTKAINIKLAKAEKDARDRAESESKAKLAAQASEREAKRFNQFLRDLFLTSDPMGFEGSGLRTAAHVDDREMTASELLETGYAKMKTDLQDAPQARAALLESLGHVIHARGDLDRARPLLEEALMLRRENSNTTSEELAGCQHLLAWLKQDLGEFDEAERMFREVLTVRETTGDELKVASAKFHLAWVLVHRFGAANDAQADEALKLLQEVIDVRQKHFGETGREVGLPLMAQGLISMGREHLGPQQREKALPLLTKALNALGGKDAVNACVGPYLLSQLFRKQKDYAKAIELHRKALEAAKKVVAERHPYYILGLGDFAGLLLESGDKEGAEQTTRRVVELGMKSPLRWHPIAARFQNDLGRQLEARGFEQNRPADLAEAEKYYRNALQVAKRTGWRSMEDEVRNRFIGMLRRQKRDPEANELEKAKQ